MQDQDPVLFTDLQVEGQLPAELDGIYARVGKRPLTLELKHAGQALESRSHQRVPSCQSELKGRPWTLLCIFTTGPNPLHVSGDYHWFDGDGRIHAQHKL